MCMENLCTPFSREEAFSRARAAVAPLLDWYRENRRDLPWRRSKDPYRIWVSEIMLQQTRVEAVIPYYERFLAAFPDVGALAAAEEENLLKQWEGLGYYSRVRNMKKAAAAVVSRYDGRFPPSYRLLLDLPGLGEYTAGAVASIAFGEPVPAVDGNVLRVFSRFLSAEGDIQKQTVRKSWGSFLSGVIPPEAPGDYNQALMELGATVCLPKTPGCAACPVSAFCSGFAGGNPDLFPLKAPKPARRVEERTIFILKTPQGVYLRRREEGLLAGMWEFPGAPGLLTRAQATALLKERGLSPGRILTLRPAKHIFTHVEWRMAGFYAECGPFSPKEGVFAAVGEIREKYPLPSAFKAYREALFALEEPEGEKHL